MNTAPPLTLIRNAEVYAPEPLGPQQLLLAGGKIVWMAGMSAPTPSGVAAEAVDLQGLRLIPGLVDGHVHTTGGGGEGGFATRVPALPLSRYTHGGVTTVIGLLGTDDCARSVRELVATLYGLREEGLSAWGYCGGYHLPCATLTGSVRADIAFIDPLIGVGELAISDHRSSQPTLEELLRVASEAHVAGLMSGKAGLLHLHLGNGSRGLQLIRAALDQAELPARVYNPTHVNRRTALFEEALELAERGCHIDLTAFPVDEDEDAYTAAQGLQRYLASGLPADRISISSDAGGCLPCFDDKGQLCSMDIGSPGALLGTLRDCLTAGLPLEQILPSMTRNPALLLRLHSKGRIAVGADADLVALSASGTASDVWALGVRHVADGQLVRRGRFE
ncbi:beta-aspartyl-peptidase [Pseudomarimonas arenosa]|uniref:Isoaspartyl dipeptidase n=1 Tax=Pseudomarimonas arenosa TaxID=2774145 RepID=A0AAW3ZR40_9GAMM|nr:beta-aspartyl-peptidase [Pseudomarimonas arenosa]MBD8527084.1 beta-aspartyl-peptidase [Pseudomarimonas arenosa]